MMKFTVITIAYNEAKTIADTVKSVLEQDYRNLEYLILDGNSSDNTVEIVQRFVEESGQEVKIYSEDDFGIYNAMNRGIARASGDYVIFMNAGDSFWNNTVLTDIAAKIRRYGRAIYYGKTCLLERGGNRGGRDFSKLGYSVYDALMKGRMPTHQSIVAPLETLRENYFNEKYKIRADYDWLLRCYKEGIRFVNLDCIVCKFDCGGVSSKAIGNNSIQVETNIIRKKNYPVVGRVYEFMDKWRI